MFDGEEPQIYSTLLLTEYVVCCWELLFSLCQTQSIVRRAEKHHTISEHVVFLFLLEFDSKLG
jgi:hypothetical protein